MPVSTSTLGTGPLPPNLQALNLGTTAVAPPRDPVWNGWDVLLIAGLGFVTLFVVEFFTAVGAHLLLFPRRPFLQLLQDPALSLVGEFLAYIPIALFMIMLVEGKYHARFWQAIRWNWPRSGWRLFGLGVLLLISVDLLAHFLPMPKSTPFDKFFDSPRIAYLTTIFAITIGPFMEELFFRGLLYPVLARRLGVSWGIILTALLFALMHLSQYAYAWGVVLLIFIMGVACTVVRAMTGSVASSFLVHVGYNAAEMVALMLVTDGFRHMEKALISWS